MDWNVTWLFTGAAAFVLVLVNLCRCARGKTRGRETLLFASLACGALTLLNEYRMAATWIAHGDLAAVEDVVPSMADALTLALLLGLALNALVLLAGAKAERD